MGEWARRRGGEEKRGGWERRVERGGRQHKKIARFVCYFFFIFLYFIFIIFLNIFLFLSFFLSLYFLFLFFFTGYPITLASGSTASTCAAYCNGNAACQSWTFNKATTQCYLKSAPGSPSPAASSLTSGVKGKKTGKERGEERREEFVLIHCL